jgi:hypothetical protein
MMNYGDALGWCIRNEAVFRFIRRRDRAPFLYANESIPGDLALELAVTLNGKTYAGHYPLDSSKEPSAAVAVALIGCVEWFVNKQGQLAAIAGQVN